MTFKSINPYTNEEVFSFQEQTEAEFQSIIEKTDKAFRQWKDEPVAKRSELLAKAADELEKNMEEYSKTITLEMGKPIAQSRAEVQKCAWVCRFYAGNAQRFLADEIIETDASESFISYDPLGSVFAIMPWNYPFWQVFRFAAPALAAGNAGILKHAPNVFESARKIEQVFLRAGFPEHIFSNIFIHHDKTEKVISNEKIKAVTLTGSERAGRSVGALAGKYLKKSVLELGGSNAFLVFDDANLEETIETAVTARFQNAGQSCIAAKRFIVTGSVYDSFMEGFTKRVKQLKQGDPMSEETDIGPLAREDLAENIHKQVTGSVKKGAELLTGGERDGASYQPTILANVTPGMPAFDEETFGPVAAVTRANDENHAIDLAANSDFGLGATICTRDIDKARHFVKKIPDGALFINELVKSDPRLPFGGTKNSGYGRELSREGIREFLNIKTVFVK